MQNPEKLYRGLLRGRVADGADLLPNTRSSGRHDRDNALNKQRLDSPGAASMSSSRLKRLTSGVQQQIDVGRLAGLEVMLVRRGLTAFRGPAKHCVHLGRLGKGWPGEEGARGWGIAAATLDPFCARCPRAAMPERRNGHA
jgi:hypothetical protein